jgi:hypothetical protein
MAVVSKYLSERPSFERYDSPSGKRIVVPKLRQQLTTPKKPQVILPRKGPGSYSRQRFKENFV